MMGEQTADVKALRLRLGAVWIGSLLCALLALLLVHRMPLGDVLPLAWVVQPTRLALAMAGGAALAGAGLLFDWIGGRPMRDLSLLGISAGGALGAALGMGTTSGIQLGTGVAGAVLGYIVSRLAEDADGRGAPLIALFSFASLAALLYATFLARGTLGSERALLLWAMGDVSGATLGSGLVLMVLVLAALGAGALALRRIDMTEDLERRSRLEGTPLHILAAVLLGLGIGSVGPVAFVGLLVPLFVRRVLASAAKPAQLLGCAGIGAASLGLADSLPRYLVGGYALPINVSLVVALLPVLLLLNIVHRRQRSSTRREDTWDAIEAAGAVLLALVSLFVVFRFVALVDVLT